MGAIYCFSQVVMEKAGGNCRDQSGFILSLILVSNLGAAKSIAHCEATELGKYVICKYIF